MTLNEDDKKRVYNILEQITIWLDNKRKYSKNGICVELPSSKNKIRLVLIPCDCFVIVGETCYSFMDEDEWQHNNLFKNKCYLNDILDFIMDWDYIKTKILESIDEPNKLINLIRNFKI